MSTTTCILVSEAHKVAKGSRFPIGGRERLGGGIWVSLGSGIAWSVAEGGRSREGKVRFLARLRHGGSISIIQPILNGGGGHGGGYGLVRSHREGGGGCVHGAPRKIAATIPSIGFGRRKQRGLALERIIFCCPWSILARWVHKDDSSWGHSPVGEKSLISLTTPGFDGPSPNPFPQMLLFQLLVAVKPLPIVLWDGRARSPFIVEEDATLVPRFDRTCKRGRVNHHHHHLLLLLIHRSDDEEWIGSHYYAQRVYWLPLRRPFPSEYGSTKYVSESNICNGHREEGRTSGIKITDCMIAKNFHESYLHRGTRHPERRRRGEIYDCPIQHPTGLLASYPDGKERKDRPELTKGGDGERFAPRSPFLTHQKDNLYR